MSARVFRQLYYSRPTLGRSQNASQRRKPLLLEVSRRHPIRPYHEFFDQLGSAILLVCLQIDQRIAIEHGTGLDSLQRQSAMLMPPSFHRLCDAILEPKILVEARYFCYRRGRGPISVEPRSDAVVGEF